VASDTSLRELHDFAVAAGIPERAFEGDHYDVPEERYAQTVRTGAVPVSGRELLRRLQLSGLRRSKRRGERVLVSRFDDDARHRIDSVLSTLPPLGPVARVHVCLLIAGRLLVARDGEGFRLPSAQVAPGEQVPGVARELVAGLLGASWRASWNASGGGQVGYLRRVPHGQVRPLEFEVVLRWPDPLPAPDAARSAVVLPAPVGRPAGRTGGRIGESGESGEDGEDGGALQWVPARRAGALLPVELAPVALHEHHRLRPGTGELPVPLKPEER
jgi:hypothetical protein